MTVEDGEEVEMKTESSKDKQTAKDEIKKKKNTHGEKNRIMKETERKRERPGGERYDCNII